MPTELTDKSYWPELARAYALLGPPLRPSAADIACFEETVAHWAARSQRNPIRAMLLGVTPEIARMKWPQGTRLIAADQSVPMIQSVWPGDDAPSRFAVCADWLRMPLRDASCDVVVGDGSINCVRYGDDLRTLARNVSRILDRGGIFVARYYLQNAVPEKPEEVIEAAFNGNIASFHHFKLRLLLAMQQDVYRGVALDDVYRFWTEHVPDPSVLASRSGWDKTSIDMMQLYRGTQTVHTFPTLAELRSVFREFFQEIAAPDPASPENCCPILGLQPRRNSNGVLR